MTPRTYGSPEAFKQALEQRLRTSVPSGAGLARKRQLLVFERFLARVVAVVGDAATLKGGWSSSCASTTPSRGCRRRGVATSVTS